MCALRSVLPPKNPTQVSEDQSQGQFAQHPNIHSWGHMETQPLSEESPMVMVPAETMRLGPQMYSLTQPEGIISRVSSALAKCEAFGTLSPIWC